MQKCVATAEAEKEEAWIDLETVRGYKRTVLCEGVREELRLNLGDEDLPRCAELLRGITDGRLVPTPWLNQVRRACCRQSRPARHHTGAFFL